MDEKNEELYLRSLDGRIGDTEGAQLSAAKETDSRLQIRMDQFVKVRAMLLRQGEDSFGPFFAERIINRIKSMKKEIDYQVFFFFKKYQMAAIGVVVALLVLNIIYADRLTIKSVLGFEEEQIDNIVTIDLYQDLTK